MSSLFFQSKTNPLLNCNVKSKLQAESANNPEKKIQAAKNIIYFDLDLPWMCWKSPTSAAGSTAPVSLNKLMFCLVCEHFMAFCEVIYCIEAWLESGETAYWL